MFCAQWPVKVFMEIRVFFSLHWSKQVHCEINLMFKLIYHWRQCGKEWRQLFSKTSCPSYCPGRLDHHMVVLFCYNSKYTCASQITLKPANLMTYTIMVCSLSKLAYNSNAWSQQIVSTLSQYTSPDIYQSLHEHLMFPLFHQSVDQPRQ